MHPGGAQLCSVCCQPPPEEFPTTSPVLPWDHQKGGSPGKLPTTTHARNETHGDDLTRVMRGLTIWTTTPNPQQHPLSLARPATQQPCSPKCLASAHRHTPSLSDAPTPSHRSQTVRPDAKLRLPLPYSQPGSPRGQLPGIYLHKQTLSPTTSHSRSDASQHHRRRYQQHYRRNLPLPSAEGYAVWLFRGQSNCHVIKKPSLCRCRSSAPPIPNMSNARV